MKHKLPILGVLLAAGLFLGATTVPILTFSAGDPEGACSPENGLYFNISSDRLWICPVDTWIRIAGSDEAAGGGWTFVASTADVSTTSNTVDSTVTGLTIPVLADTDYQIRCAPTTSAAASTTGVQLTLSGPASPTQINWTHLSQNTATAAIMVSFNAYGIDARTGHDGSDRVVESVYIRLRNGSNAGDVTFAVRSEILDSAVTVYEGSYCEYRSY